MKLIGQLRSMMKEDLLTEFIRERRQNAILINNLYEEITMLEDELKGGV